MPDSKSTLTQGAPPPTLRWRFLNWPAKARRVATLTIFLVVTGMLLAPTSSLPDVALPFPYLDKVTHIGIFAVLAAAVRWSLPFRAGQTGQPLMILLMLCAYGFGIECLQPLMPAAGRSFEWADLLADGVGTILGLWACGRLTDSAVISAAS